MTAVSLGCAAAAATQSTGTPSLPKAVADLLQAGHYAEAEALAERAYQERLTSTDPEGAGDLFVQTLVLNGRGSEPRTRELAEGIVAARRTAGVPAPLATSLRHLGDVQFQTGDYRAAVVTFREALAHRDRAGAAETAETAEDLEHLVQALTRQLVTEGRLSDNTAYAEAVQLIDRAVAIRGASGAARGVAQSLRVRGVLRQSNGEHLLARTDLAESLKLFQSFFPTHPETALALAQLGEQQHFDGALTQGRDTLERACAMAETRLRTGHPDIAICLQKLALVLDELGDLAGARPVKERAMAIAEASLGTDHPRFAVQLNDLANTYLLQGEFSTARALYDRARTIYARRFGPTNNGVTVATYNLALIDTRLGDYQQARRELERVIASWTQALGPKHANVARALAAFADTFAPEGRDAEAHPYYTRALQIREQAFGPTHVVVARTLSRLAETMSRLGQPRRAMDLSSRALAILENSGAQEELAQSIIAHAEILVRGGDDPGAEAAYKRALDIRTRLLDKSHPSIAETEVALAAVEMRLDRPVAAFSRALRGEQIGRGHARLTLGSLPERQALDYAAKRPNGLDLALSLVESPADRAAVFNELVLGRSLTLDEMAARRRVVADAEGGEATALWADLRSSRQRLANLVVRGAGAGGPQQYAALIDAARAEKESAERALAAQSATFSANERRAEVGLDQIRGAIPTGAALVSFVRYGRAAAIPSASAGATRGTPTTVPSYVAFVLRSGELEPAVVQLGSASLIERDISAWRRELTAGVSSPGGLAEAERTLRVAGSRLRRRIWDPVSKQLDGVTRVLVVPDSAINLVPLAALPVATGGYLLEHGPVIHYLSAERDLVSTERPAVGGSQSLLAVGGPAFADRSPFAALRTPDGPSSPPPGASPADATPPQAVLAAALPATGFRGTASLCATFQNMQFPALPGATREAEDVAALWTSLRSSDGNSATPSRALVGGAASERAFKELGPGRRVLHLATHGFFLGDECGAALDNTRAVGGLVAAPASQPPRAQRSRRAGPPENPLLLSGLALAGANRRAAAGPDEDDGILTAEEVASLDLTGVEWAVLSACETGLGLIRAGEGVLGLRRAFQVAGARTVIMSLWSVEDRTTQRWMQALYRGRLERNLDTADAVHEAGLAVLRDRRGRGLSAHPFYWAGFVAAGDWH
jgi:CHAT domain-containing protein/tetratricopeptide (TPR) repeat protein